ncbi:uncharacterized protein LOC116849331 [Odontomachus brunneus]|uniref:uncharacterized protein LOC116849331 n=1 Tax=Odontomachus brunneus TaxID=486640 RepID=UPI0013F281D5|nr:uncharacterized protein LOC116849331 [Odontomachus brunneus]
MFQRNLEALVVPRLTAYRPFLADLPMQWSHLAGLPLADDLQASDTVLAVLGAEFYAAVVLSEIRRGPALAPVAQATRLGWVLLGLTAPDQGTQSVHCSTVRCVDEALNAELRRFWELEEVPKTSPLTPGEEECERHFSATHTRQRDGRYLVRLPLKPDAVVGESKPAAHASLARLERRLQTSPELRKAYHAFLDDYERRGHMRRVSENKEVTGRPGFYMPHHPVIEGSGSALKLRVVFNASQGTATGPSLNAVVHVGPRLQQDLGGVLLRWRMERIVFIADIEQMYRQIIVHSEHQPLQRILWRPSSTRPVQVYQLCTVTYGTACAPFLVLRVLQQLARDKGTRYPQAAELLRRSTYVDDVLAGAASVEEALTLQTELISLLRAVGFSLKKWAANTVLESVPMDCRLSLVPLRDHAELGTPVLGVQWIPEEDAFGYG